MEGKKVEEEEDPYYTPATKESELYAQLHRQGIKMIRDRDIEWVNASMVYAICVNIYSTSEFS